MTSELREKLLRLTDQLGAALGEIAATQGEIRAALETDLTERIQRVRNQPRCGSWSVDRDGWLCYAGRRVYSPMSEHDITVAELTAIGLNVRGYIEHSAFVRRWVNQNS
jgi:hypothetical protein